MGKPGVKPQGKVKIKWSPEFAYAIGLLVTDGSLSKDGRHIDLTSVEKEQLENFNKCLGTQIIIGTKKSQLSPRGFALRVQFGDVLFYKFLLEIGLMPNKTKIIGEVDIPKKYFFDFLRGHLDGDGCFYSYWDPRWRASFMFYTTFLSASEKHVRWLRTEIDNRLGIQGAFQKNGACYTLKYAKEESFKLLKRIYYSDEVVCLSRKRLKIERALDTIGLSL